MWPFFIKLYFLFIFYFSYVTCLVGFSCSDQKLCTNSMGYNIFYSENPTPVTCPNLKNKGINILHWTRVSLYLKIGYWRLGTRLPNKGTRYRYRIKGKSRRVATTHATAQHVVFTEQQEHQQWGKIRLLCRGAVERKNPGTSWGWEIACESSQRQWTCFCSLH